MLNGCPREQEIKELVQRGQWPLVSETRPELAAHLYECRACADLALVTDAFQRARANAAGPRIVGSPGLLLWRAQLKRRQEAMVRIARPILAAQIFALTLILGVTAAFVASHITHGAKWLNWFAITGQAGEIGSMIAEAFSGWGLLVTIPAVAALALLGGAAVYLAAERR